MGKLRLILQLKIQHPWVVFTEFIFFFATTARRTLNTDRFRCFLYDFFCFLIGQLNGDHVIWCYNGVYVRKPLSSDSSLLKLHRKIIVKNTFTIC